MDRGRDGEWNGVDLWGEWIGKMRADGRRSGAARSAGIG
jgi:hypothetical protein